MFAPQHDFFIALNKARIAGRRGDVAAAERWLRCAEKHMRIAERFQDLVERQERDRVQRNPWPASK
jgi:hypothetical protein